MNGEVWNQPKPPPRKGTSRLRTFIGDPTMSAMRRTQFVWVGISVALAIAVGLWLRARSASEVERVPQPIVVTAAPVATSLTPSKPTEGKTNGLEVQVLRAEDDTPLSGASVWFELRGSPGLPPERTTDSAGVARWEDLGPSQRTVGATAPGRITLTERVFVPESGAGPPLVLRLEAQRSFEVRLVNAAGDDLKPSDLGLDPQAGQSVTVVLSGKCGQPGEKLDTRGAPTHRVKPLSWDGLRFAWHVDVRGVGPACVHVVVGDVVLAARELEPNATQVALQIDSGLLGAASTPFVVRTLAADDGRALAKVEVRVRTPNGFEVERVTDDDGRVRFGGVLSGEFVIEALAPGFARTEVRLRRPLPEEVVLRLAQGRMISGILMDENDQPFAKTKVAIYRAEQLGKIAEPMEIRTTNFDGRFEFRGVSTDELVLFGIGNGDGRGFLPPRETLPPTARLVPSGGDAVEVRVRGFVPQGPPAPSDIVHPTDH